MRDRAEVYLKLASALLAVALLFQWIGVARRWSPNQRTAIPEPASWTAPAPEKAAGGSPGGGSGAPPGPVPGPRRGMRGSGGPGGGGGGLPPEVQARVDKVVQSELLGPVMRPPPMALIGIVGKDVLLRAPNGQSGLVKEGGELGGVQLLRIGTNRVLVKENGQTKELMIFDGIGGESLLTEGKDGTK